VLIICTALFFGGFLLAPLILGQRLLPRGRLVATELVKNGGIKLGHLYGGERQGKMSQRWSTVPHFGGGLQVGQRRYRQRRSVFGCLKSLVGLVGQRFLLRGRLVATTLLGERLLGQRRSVVGRLRHSVIPRRIALRYPGEELAGGREAELGHVLKLGGTKGSLPTSPLVGLRGERLGVRVVLLTM
jgi:hypothetical protein